MKAATTHLEQTACGNRGVESGGRREGETGDLYTGGGGVVMEHVADGGGVIFASFVTASK